jgi:hypothetical protein
MKFTCNISKKLTADVVVIGGGTAGVFAAISAAKTGAETVLLEKNSMLGGTMTVAGVNFPGLFFAWGKQIISGPCWEAIERTIELGGAQMPEIVFHPQRHYEEQILLNRFIYTAVLFEMCRESGVHVITNSMISAVEENDNEIRIIATEKNGLFEIVSKTAVDATGDANLSVLAGYKVYKSPVQQPATLQNKISGYDLNSVSEQEIKEKFKTAGLPQYINADMLIAYLKIGKIDMHIPCIDADTSEGKTELEKKSLHEMLKIYKFYKSINGLENLTVDFIAEETGVRETNRIIGEKTITANEYIEGISYPDSICYAFYPIDLHVMNGIEQKFHKENIVAKIPYTALIPKDSKHILCAGRCISSDSYANSAVRVEAVCMATGQAAGCAAALCALNKCKVREISYNDICIALRKINAIVPE